MIDCMSEKSDKGFTLIEILIVVIILAVLAALILPKFLSQTENAYISEANRMLAAITRAQETTMAIQELATGASITTGIAIPTACPLTASCDADEWSAIGMQPPSPKSHFDYSCTDTTCTAERTVNGFLSSITFNYTPNVHAFTDCDGIYTLITSGTSATSDRGCRVST
ncbi:MAG TPA: prepilin-type N-terminal cleavage/methylation domain-containing protein [Candidatus Gracilibacteria bacterium]|nr:prepilin-type N-terminal cleavage/methylation domain-containing protein [Candidatus Gracilibacteria bacterium]